MRAFLATATLLVLTACAAPSTQYSVAAPDAVAIERAKQHEIVNSGQRQRLGERAPDSPTIAFDPGQRTLAVAERILIAAAPFCGQQLMSAYPISVGTRDNGPPEVISAAGDLRFGDRIVAIDGRPVPGGKQGYVFLNREGGQKAGTGQPLQLTALRGRRQLEATYTDVPACAYELKIHNKNEWNAYADGSSVNLDVRLIRDLSNDDDLAFVIAHELAHNILNHVGKSQQNAMAGAAVGLGIEAIVGALGGGSLNGELARAGAGAGQMRYSQDFEREADYMGLYIQALAGYDLQAGPRVARRIAEQDPRAITYASSHPTSADRAASLQVTIEEIKAKQKSGAPLAPNPAPKKKRS